MALYYYLKLPVNFSSRDERKRRLFSYLLMAMGFLIISVVLGSIGFYQLSADRFQRQTDVVIPFSQASVLGKSEMGIEEVDYTQIQNWFTDTPHLPSRESKITHYNLSIPKLDIYKAVVEIGGEDLGKSMIHYPGTGLPGEVGSAVVFCHSVLPQFFNPKNYKTICSTLPTLQKGDKVLVFFDGIQYTYQVVEMFEVEPNDISVLDQRVRTEYLNLVTCVPPGTYLRRLVVRARLIY